MVARLTPTKTHPAEPAWLKNSPNHVMLHQTLGDIYRKTHRYPDALKEYQWALSDPTLLPTVAAGLYTRMGKLYIQQDAWPQAVEAFQQAMRLNPKDIEPVMLLAEIALQQKQWVAAIALYDRAAKQKPLLDNIQRARAWALSQWLSNSNPSLAGMMQHWHEERALSQAKALVQAHLPQQAFGTIQFQFSATQRLFAVSNMAEYDHSRREIRLLPELAYSHPAVVAAYIIHELVHANDADGQTSLHEEQDGYRALAVFWKKNKGTLEETNLDFALGLWQRSPAQLDAKVSEVYRTRNSRLPDTSPCHGQPC